MEEQVTRLSQSISPSSTPNKNSDPDPDHDHDHDPPPSATGHGGDTPEEEGPEKTGEPKKRKSCPSAVDKCEALDINKKKKSSPLNSSYSFTFDTKSCGGSGFVSTPESTPKFGSFNLAASAVIESKGKARENEEGGGKEDRVAGLEPAAEGIIDQSAD